MKIKTQSFNDPDIIDFELTSYESNDKLKDDLQPISKKHQSKLSPKLK